MRVPASRPLAIAAALISLLWLSACHSDHVEITIQNQTGSAIRLLEVDYPSASFGAETLANGASFHYRIQVQGTGSVNITYSDPHNAQPHIAGPVLSDRQQGSLEVLLLPNGKAEFKPKLSNGR